MMPIPALIRNATEKIKLPTGKTGHIPKCCTTFTAWDGGKIPNKYRKPMLMLDGKPLYAELVVVRKLQNEGWQVVWVDSFGGIKYRDDMPHLKDPVCLKPRDENLLEKIRVKVGCRGGCFDVYAWRGQKHRFIELKRRGKDRIRKTQKRWLAAARRCKVKMSDLLIVEWTPAN